MNRIISLIMFAFAVSYSIFLVYWAHYTFGFRKRNLIYVSGYLENTELKRNVFRGHPLTGKWHKHWTNCTYVYLINEQPYSVQCGISGQRKDVPKSVTVAVQKHTPKNAFIPQFEKIPSPFTLLFPIAGFILFLFAGLYLWNK